MLPVYLFQPLMQFCEVLCAIEDIAGHFLPLGTAEVGCHVSYHAWHDKPVKVMDW